MLNPHFSQEHADAVHDGKETENNKRLDWEDEMQLRDIEGDPEFIENGTYILRGMKGETETFEFPIANMSMFEFKMVDGQMVQIACSKDLYEEHTLDSDERLLRLILKGDPYANPIPGVYIASNDFPADLILGA
jgi:hypothetical protein